MPYSLLPDAVAVIIGAAVALLALIVTYAVLCQRTSARLDRAVETTNWATHEQPAVTKRRPMNTRHF